jgi:hypothetical protein
MGERIRDLDAAKRKANPVGIDSHPDVNVPEDKPQDTPPGEMIDKDPGRAEERPSSGKSNQHFRGDQS